MSEIVSTEWYSALVEDCKAIITEATFTSRWALVEGYHGLGERIRQDGQREPMGKLLQALAVSMEKSERSLWYAVQFYDKYPDLEAVPGGKSITWNKVIGLLPEHPSDDALTRIRARLHFAKAYAKETATLAADLSAVERGQITEGAGAIAEVWRTIC